MRPRSILALILLLVVVAPLAAQTGWDSDDFLITDAFQGVIAVYDSDFTFKGFLDQGFPEVRGLDFLADGNLVAVGMAEVRIYSPAGSQVGGFFNPVVGLQPTDIKASAQDLLYVATQEGEVRELDLVGNHLRSFGSLDLGVAVLPGDQLWLSGGAPFYEVVDLLSGTVTASNLYTAPQIAGTTLRYDEGTQSVLAADLGGFVYEYDAAGNLLTAYAPATFFISNGLTHGPNNDVFATGCGSSTVDHWDSTGAYVQSHPVPEVALCTGGILWGGLSNGSTASYRNLGQCISTRILDNCRNMTASDRAACNHEQRDFCRDLFGKGGPSSASLAGSTVSVQPGVSPLDHLRRR